MAEFTVNPTRHDPYKNFKFRVKWDGAHVAGVSKVSGLKRSTEVVEDREGGDPSTSRKSPGRTRFDAITLERALLKILRSRTGRIRCGRWQEIQKLRSLIFARIS
jgi:hypothetical protein